MSGYLIFQRTALRLRPYFLYTRTHYGFTYNIRPFEDMYGIYFSTEKNHHFSTLDRFLDNI